MGIHNLVEVYTQNKIFIWSYLKILGHTQIVIDYSVRFLKVVYVLVKFLFESGFSCPLYYIFEVFEIKNEQNSTISILNSAIIGRQS